MVNVCSPKALKASAALVGKLNRGNSKQEVLLGNIKSIGQAFVGNDNISSNDLAEILLGMYSMNRAGVLKARKLSAEELIDHIEEYKIQNPEELADKMSQLGEYANVETLAKLIDKTKPSNTVTVGEGKGQLAVNAAKESNSSEAYIDDTRIGTVVRSFERDPETFILKQKERRENLTEGLSERSLGKWGALIGVYFPGISSVGREFTEWSRDIFNDKIFDNSTIESSGFSENIDSAITKIKNNLDIANNSAEMSETGEPLADRLVRDEEFRIQYFNKVLATDFDFILENLIKIASVDGRLTEKRNNSVGGLNFVGQPAIEAIPLNISNRKVKALFTRGENFKELILKESVNGEIESPPGSELAFLQNTELANARFYFLEDSKKMFYRTNTGENIDISPKSVYSYSHSSNRNHSSIDNFQNPFDNSTKFLNNLFSMFRIIQADGSYGDRMTTSDFVTVAPLTLGLKNNAEVEAKLIELMEGEGNSKVSTIARTLYHYVYRTQAANEIDIFSINQLLSNSKNKNKGTINHDIMNSMFSAMVSKDHLRYLILEEGRTKETRGPNESTEFSIIDEEIAGLILDGKYTKDFMANKIVANPDRTVSILNTDGTHINLQSISTVEKIDNSNTNLRHVTTILGLTPLLEKTLKKFPDVYRGNAVDSEIINVFKGIIEVAAANKASERLPLTDAQKAAKEVITIDSNYLFLSPSMLLSTSNIRNLAEVFSVDSSKNQTIAGEVKSTSTTPNRNSVTKQQVETTKTYNRNVNNVSLDYNPYLKEGNLDAARSTITRLGALNSADLTTIEAADLVNAQRAVDSNITPARVGDIMLKASIKHDGETLKISDWDIKTRVEFSMIQGFLGENTKNIGREFNLQALNYSDKSNIELHKIFVEENLLASSSDVGKKLEKAYIEYQIGKNEALQKITIDSLVEFIVGDFAAVRDMMVNAARFEYTNETDPEVVEEVISFRVGRLAELKSYLMENPYGKGFGDMTRPINDYLKDIHIPPSDIETSTADMDIDADYISFKGQPNTAILKPMNGIRAEAFINKGTEILKYYLSENRKVLRGSRKQGTSLESYSIDEVKIQNALDFQNKKEGVSIVSSAGTFFDRYFLINAIYGHGIKTIIMGDESYFKTGYDSTSYDQYIQNADSLYESDNIEEVSNAGLEGVEGMLRNQFKRGQSILTRGVVYAQTETIEGIKRARNKRNLLQRLDIYTNEDGSKRYSFDTLNGNSLTELYGKGYLDWVEDGSGILAADYNGHRTVRLNVGNNKVTFNTDPNVYMGLISDEMPLEMLQGIANMIETTMVNSDPTLVGNNIVVDSKSEVYRGNALTLNDFRLLERQQSQSNGSIVMPDITPVLAVTDPESTVSILGEMDVDQENSDGLQMIHPLLHLIQKHARGNSLGAFNTDRYEASKSLNTTQEYSKNRQVLLKNSGQMPFSVSQMKRLGSIALFNAFKKMNTAIDFKQPFMTYTDSSGIELTVEAHNLDELFRHFDGYGKAGDAAWTDVIEVLRQNQANMYSFIGALNLQSSQKSGLKKATKFENLFNNNIDTSSANIGYMSNEFHYEVLSKEHGYDVSGKLNKRAFLSLLSQLVNSVAFGGLSNVTTTNLQNAMGQMMRISRLRVGRDLANITEGIRQDSPDEFPGANFNQIIKRLNSGQVSTKGYDEATMALYNRVMRLGVVEMAKMSFDEGSDSPLMKKIIEGEQFSLDTPMVQSKVMNTLRSAFFKDTVKMRMQGFEGVSTTTHKTINIFEHNGKRQGRSSYIKHMLSMNDDYDFGILGGYTTELTEDTKQDVLEKVMPYDAVKVDMIRSVSYPDGSVEEGITDTQYLTLNDVIDANGNIITPEVDPNSPVSRSYRITVVYTPDVALNTDIPSIIEYNQAGDNSLITIRTGYNKTSTYYKWFIDEQYTYDQITAMLGKGDMSLNVDESYSLKWYEYTNNDPNVAENDIKDTAAYRNLYRETVLKGNKITQDELDILRGHLVGEIQMKNPDNTPKWSIKSPEVVLPTFMKDRFNIPEDTDLTDLLGFSTNEDSQRLHLAERLKSYIPKDDSTSKHKSKSSRFRSITPSDKHYSVMLTRIYAKRVASMGNEQDGEILDYLNSVELPRAEAEAKNSGVSVHDIKLSDAAIAFINDIRDKEYSIHINSLAHSFMEMLNVVLTRIPGQSKQSGFSARVIEFLDAQGNAAYAPTEHLVTTGGDFDIDTLRVLTKSMDADGKLFPVTKTIDGKIIDTEGLMVDYMADIERAKIRVDDYIELSNKKAQEYVDRLDELIAIEKSKEPSDEVDKEVASLTIRKSNAEKNVYTGENIQKIRESAIRRVHDRYENMFTNTISSAVYDSLNSVDSAVEVNTPMSLSILKNMVKDIESKNPALESFGMNGETFWPIYIYEELAAQGKEGIGVFATSLKVTSAVNAAKINYDNLGYDLGQGDSNPFLFNSEVVYRVRGLDGKLKTVNKTRHTFADLDRFSITKRTAEEIEIREAFNSLRLSQEDYDSNSVSTLVNLLEGEIGQAVLDINKGITSQKLAKANAKSVIKQKAEDFLDMEITDEILNSENPLEAIKIHLQENPSVVESSILSLVGRLHSNDVQSQYLTAATDNAKELILGKIRSSTLTNPIITTMMVLGYDIDTIIEFLYDPSIESVLTALIAEKRDLTKVFLNPRAVENLRMDSQSISSLIKILEVGDQIKIFRNVRSLNENNRIDQYFLDKIMDTLPADLLYDAIINDGNGLNVNKLKDYYDPDSKKLTAATRVFDPTMMIFLHPQSRELFVNIYESEEYKMRALFRSVRYMREQAGSKNRDEISYKSIKNVLSGMKVVSFLSNPVKSGSSVTDGEKYRMGIIIPQSDEDGTLDPTKVQRYKLDTISNRAKFVKEFPKYFEYIKQQFPNNAGLEALGYSKIFGSTEAVLSFREAKKSFADGVEIDLIKEGINELKYTSEKIIIEEETDEQRAKRIRDNEDLDQLKREAFQNLSLYALLVSGGELRSGTMIEMFDDINEDLSLYLNDLDESYYNDNFKITDPLAVEILTSSIPIYDVLRDKADKEDGSLRDIEGAGYMEDVYSGYEGYSDMGDEGIEAAIAAGRGSSGYTQDLVVRREQEGTNFTEDKVYRFVSSRLRDAIFYTYRSGEISYRIFDSESRSSTPYAFTEDTGQKLQDVDKEFINSLSKIGKQIGYKVSLNGEPAWILAFNGNKSVEGADELFYSEYLVHYRGRTSTVPGARLMEQNDTLFLDGNIIKPIESFDLTRYDTLKKKHDDMNKYIPTVAEDSSYSYSVRKNLTDIFTSQEIRTNPIVKREVRIKYDYMVTVPAMDETYETTTINRYMSSDTILSATSESPSAMVPSIIVPSGGPSTESEEVLPEMTSTILDMINKIANGKKKVFQGIETLGNVDDMVGGINIFKEAILPHIDTPRVKRVKDIGNKSKHTMLGGAFTVKIKRDKTNLSTIIATVTRTKKEPVLIRNEKNKYVPLNVVTDKESGAKSFDLSSVTKKADKANLTLIGMDKGLLNIPHTVVNHSILGNNSEIYSLNGNNDKRLFVKKVDIGGFTTFYEMTPKKGKWADSRDGFNDGYKKFYTTQKEIDTITEKVLKSRDIKNKSC